MTKILKRLSCMVKVGMYEALVADLQKAKAVLENINWSFYPQVSVPKNTIYPFNCRKHHWFPATFIPEIPFTL